MTGKLFVRVFSIVLLSVPVTCQGERLQYNEPIMLEGTLITSEADPAITFDEKPHSFPALSLSKPISVNCFPGDEECSPELGVTLLQLVLGDSEMAKFKQLKGSSAKVKGTLFHCDNGHHFTSVLLDVEAIAK